MTTARLIDMLDFSRKDFNKVISLTAKKSVEIETKWSLVKLNDIAELRRGPFGGSLKKEIFVKTGYKIYEQQHAIKNNFFIGEYYITEEKYNEMKAFELLPNDLIMSCSGTIGKLAIFPETAPKGIINQALLRLRPINGYMEVTFLKLILEYFNNIFYENSHGTGLKNVASVEVLKQIKIPFPPKDIQQKIVAECEWIDKEVENAEKFITDTQKDIEDSMRNTFSEKSYFLKKLDSLMTIGRGASPRPIQDYLTNDKNGVNWIKIGDVKQGVKYITQTEEKITPEGAEKSRFVKEGDFILSNSMSAGRPYILKISGCIHDGWLLLSEINESLDKDYFYYILAYYDAVKQQLTDNALGGTVKNLNIDRVKTIKIPVPDIEIQKNLVAQIEQLENKIATAQKTINEAADKKQVVLKYYL